MKKWIYMCLLFMITHGMVQAQSKTQAKEEKKEVTIKVSVTKTNADGTVEKKKYEFKGEDAQADLDKLKKSGELENAEVEISIDEEVKVTTSGPQKTMRVWVDSDDEENEDVMVITKNGDKSVRFKMKNMDSGEMDSMIWMMDGDGDSDENVHKKVIKMKKGDGNVFFFDTDGEKGEVHKNVIKLHRDNGNSFEIDFEDEEAYPESKVKMGILIKGSRNLMVADVIDDSPAAKAGLKKGDRIIELDGYFLDRYSDLAQRMATYESGDQVSIRYVRDGKSQETMMTLVSADD